MREFDFLSPISLNISEELDDCPAHIIGNNIRIHKPTSGMPELEGVMVAIFTVEESRGSLDSVAIPDYEHIRRSFYKLFFGNWNVVVADLGTVTQGAHLEDTLNSVEELASYLLGKNILPLAIGGSQSITHSLYRAFYEFKKGIHLVSVDSRFDFSTKTDIISNQTYMSRIINQEPLNLFNYVNLGYQTYYNAQEEVDLVEKLLFDSHRLGKVQENMTLTEVVFRNADLGSLDVFSSTKATDLGLNDGLPNGFTSKDLCTISRYAGIGDSLSAFGIFEIPNTHLAQELVAQLIWYFIEGYNYRELESPNSEDPNYEKYNVLFESQDIKFYKSKRTERWWIEFPKHFIDSQPAVFPCLHDDYLQASNNEFPEIWLKISQKLSVFE